MMQFESWRIFHIAMKKLPAGRLQAIYRRSARLIYYWAANPKYAAGQRNPIDRIRILLEEIDLAGYTAEARAAIDYMAEPLGGKFAEFDGAVSDKGSVDGEAADLAEASGMLIGAIRMALADKQIDAAERTEIMELLRRTARELAELADAGGLNKPQRVK